MPLSRSNPFAALPSTSHSTFVIDPSSVAAVASNLTVRPVSGGVGANGERRGRGTVDGQLDGAALRGRPAGVRDLHADSPPSTSNPF